MGPPPPPPPPPPLKSSATLPSGGWKATQTPRRNNNPIPASSDKTRPTVDSAALQHAAARLRKTGYYEQIRGDVPNLSDGRVAGPDQHLPDGNRPYGSQFHQLERDPPREQVHAAPAHSVQSNSIGHIRGHTNPSVNSYSNGEPSLHSSFDAAPKNLYQTYNNPSSKSFNDNKLESPYRSPTAQSYTATNHRTQYQQQQEPIYRNVSPAHAYAPPHYEDQPYAPPTHGTHQNYSSRTQYYATDNDGYNYQNSYSRETRRHEDRPQTRPTEVTLEWESPYVPQSSPILDPHARIREFATTNYIEPDPPTSAREYVRTIRRETHTRTGPEDFATSLRNQGLTASQREANQYQSSTIRRDHLPFDVDHLYKQSFAGDEVDRLISNMQTEMRVTRAQHQPSVAPGNECAVCKNPITDADPGCTAINQIFHINCFKCKTCSKKLAGSSFYNIDNRPTCKPCYEATLEKCKKCGNKITDRLLRAHGGAYHVECFTCTGCNRTLDGVPFTTDPQDNVYCVTCYQDKFAPRCAVCNKPIVPKEGEKESVRVIAMDKSFHPSCYRCEDCGMQLSSKVEGAACYPLNSHLYCKTCNGNRLRAQAAA